MIALLLALGCSNPEPAPVEDPVPAEPTVALHTGAWSAVLQSPGGGLPFGLDLSQGSAGWDAWLINGDERLRVGAAVEGDTLTLDLAPYDARIVAKVDPSGRALDGSWTKVKRGTTDSLPFRATAGRVRRFPPLVDESGGSVAGRWRLDLESEDDDAVMLLEQVDGGIEVSGTILTTTGDYRFLAGSYEGETLRLSTFDGSHAFLFHAVGTAEDGMRGDFWSGGGWHEGWTAVRDDGVTLPEPMGLTRVEERPDWGAVAFPDLEGRPRRLDDPAWADKPRLVQIMGTWCPNCNDQTDVLVELARNHPELAVVSLAFEHGDDPARNTAFVRRYAERHGAGWTWLVAGTSDKEAASAALPFLDRVRAYPTLLFVDRTGAVVAVHTGFVGPAAEREHRELVAAYERQVSALR